jgi:hypothetical protein
MASVTFTGSGLQYKSSLHSTARLQASSASLSLSCARCVLHSFNSRFSTGPFASHCTCALNILSPQSVHTCQCESICSPLLSMIPPPLQLSPRAQITIVRSFGEYDFQGWIFRDATSKHIHFPFLVRKRTYDASVDGCVPFANADSPRGVINSQNNSVENCLTSG